MRNRRPLSVALAVALLFLATIGFGVALPSALATTYTPISGEGSSWAANAIDDWRASVVNSGIKVNFAPTGSVAGLTGYANGSDDFAASEIPYGVKGTSPGVPGRGFAYVPNVAGGTSLMYNLTVGGKRFTNLKLSGPTIAGIFEGTITQWNDPKVKADNPGVALPPLKITPVVRSDGSGSTAEFSLWMSKRFGNVWTCGEISFFTQCNKYDPTVQQAKSGDNGVAGFVAQAGNVGSIGYVEYSYALQSGYPVAKVLNQSGFYVLPTASNVAVALLKATVNMNKANPNTYLTQNLDAVYTDTDPRAYPISSYSYFVVPTALQNGFTSQKGQTLGAFVDYALCAGQQAAPTLGYSPLPINLVQAGLAQVKKIPGAV
ncbi:MAG: substrate-binding domain-containing protein, partial [Marmoricola sp.]